MCVTRHVNVTTAYTHVLPGVRRVEDQDQGGQCVYQQTSDRQQVGCDSVRDFEHEPVPESLHERVQQSGAAAAVLVFGQSFELTLSQDCLTADRHRARHQDDESPLH